MTLISHWAVGTSSEWGISHSKLILSQIYPVITEMYTFKVHFIFSICSSNSSFSIKSPCIHRESILLQTSHFVEHLATLLAVDSSTIHDGSVV